MGLRTPPSKTMHHDYTNTLKAVWEKAVRLYDEGVRGSETYFNDEESAFLASIGATAQEVYDFAEDFSRGGDPDFATFAILADMRRRYFLEVQNGIPSGEIVEMEQLPPKPAEVRGISWLPRILVKAKAKLRGEMNPDLMYGCGGDRSFFRTHDIHAADFLAKVRDNMENDEAVIDWVASHSPAVSG